MVVFQTIAYASYTYFDIFVTFCLFCLNFDAANEKVYLSDAIKLLKNKIVLTLFVLALVYMLISNTIMKSIEVRRAKNVIEDAYYRSFETEENVEMQTAEQKLEQLKSMLDKQLITQDEYDQKRAEILKDM